MQYSVYFNQRKLNTNDMLALQEYAKRLSAYCRFDWYCRPADTFSSLASGQKKTEHTLWLQVHAGMSTPSSEEFAAFIQANNLQGISNICLFIGYTISPEEQECYAILPLSLATADFSAGLTGVIASEQIYRAYRILNHQPYHK